MPASDVLKNFRDKGYNGTDTPRDKEGMESESSTPLSRSIALTDDEQKAFANSKPGEEVSCEVHGSMEQDGKFRVMSVQPLGGAMGYGQGQNENMMAGQVAQRVMPNIAPSPS